MVTTCINNLSEGYAFFLLSFPGKSSKLMQIKLIGKTFICVCGSTIQQGAYLSLKFAGWHQGQYFRRHCDEAVIIAVEH